MVKPHTNWSCRWTLLWFIFKKTCSIHATIRGNIFNICNRNSILQNNSLIVWLFNWDSNKNFPIKPSHPVCGVSEIRDGEDLWQWSRLEIRLRLSSVNHTTKTIHHHHHHHHHHHNHFFVLILSRSDFDVDLMEAICLSILQ